MNISDYVFLGCRIELRFLYLEKSSYKGLNLVSKKVLKHILIVGNIFPLGVQKSYIDGQNKNFVILSRPIEVQFSRFMWDFHWESLAPFPVILSAAGGSRFC